MSDGSNGGHARALGLPILEQRWEHLLFAHWKIDRELIEPLLPRGLHVDTYAGAAWVGVVAFRMRSLRPRGLPPLPGLSNFAELNLRTYAHDDEGRRGVWFFSLDADQRIAAWIARTLFHLPYQYARMRARCAPDGWVDLRCRRPSDDLTLESRFRYRGIGAARCAEPGTLEHFLCERYRLFCHNPHSDKLYVGEVKHRPYALQPVELVEWNTALWAVNGMQAPRTYPDHVIYSAGVDVTILPLRAMPEALGLYRAVATS